MKVPEHVDLEVVALISCGVLTGWGSAVKRAGVVVAVDPADWKRQRA